MEKRQLGKSWWSRVRDTGRCEEGSTFTPGDPLYTEHHENGWCAIISGNCAGTWSADIADVESLTPGVRCRFQVSVFYDALIQWLQLLPCQGEVVVNGVVVHARGKRAWAQWANWAPSSTGPHWHYGPKSRSWIAHMSSGALRSLPTQLIYIQWNTIYSWMGNLTRFYVNKAHLAFTLIAHRICDTTLGQSNWMESSKSTVGLIPSAGFHSFDFRSARKEPRFRSSYRCLRQTIQ